MPWTAWKTDPTADSAARDVLAAYDAALRKGKPLVECYRRAVEVWVHAGFTHEVPIVEYDARFGNC
jgi:hypothetical protein